MRPGQLRTQRVRKLETSHKTSSSSTNAGTVAFTMRLSSKNLDALFAHCQSTAFCPKILEPDEGWISEAATGIIQLGRSIEQGNDLPPLPMPPTWTDSKQRRRETIKKLAMGQKLSSNQNQSW